MLHISYRGTTAAKACTSLTFFHCNKQNNNKQTKERSLYTQCLPDLLRHEKEVVHDVLRLASELLPEERVLSGNADRTGVEVTLPHHDAAHGDEGSSRERVLLSTQQSRNNHVAAWHGR